MDLTLELIVALFIFGVFIAVCCALAIAPSLNSSHLQHSAPQRRPLGVAVDAPILGPVVPSAGSLLRYFVPPAILVHVAVIATMLMIGPW